ncbi:MAG TPA: phosphate ABC transporter permease PtsA [Gammaproteobacteria bacterium]|nr:phosphate ABC transporter permease PtsA [Gammaproteobacteria bacterium]
MNNTEVIKKSLANRYKKERRFQMMGRLAVLTGFAFLVILMTDIITKSLPAFTLYYVKLDVNYSAQTLGVSETAEAEELAKGNFRKLTRDAIYDLFPEVKKRADRKALAKLVSNEAEFQVQKALLADPTMLDTTTPTWVLVDDDVDAYLKSRSDTARTSDKQIAWLETLESDGRLEKRFNWIFFENGDSREPEIAGIRGAAMGSLFTVVVCLLVSFPIGVLAAVYLEEFAPRNRWIDLVEININNLAAVPSIVFGLLGLAVFINFFGMPRSAPVVGGLVLALMTLPTIIISSRSAIKAVPPSIREAALGVGASKMQTVFQHVVPLAMPGILTGTIIGMAQALGETAPLLMIGMVAFIVDVPQGFTDSATVLPIQIYLWADSPERTFVAKTSAAIVVLLVFLVCMNAIAVFLRKKFEKSW